MRRQKWARAKLPWWRPVSASAPEIPSRAERIELDVELCRADAKSAFCVSLMGLDHLSQANEVRVDESDVAAVVLEDDPRECGIDQLLVVVFLG
jgi:hypothetical protein